MLGFLITKIYKILTSFFITRQWKFAHFCVHNTLFWVNETNTDTVPLMFKVFLSKICTSLHIVLQSWKWAIQIKSSDVHSKWLANITAWCNPHYFFTNIIFIRYEVFKVITMKNVILRKPHGVTSQKMAFLTSFSFSWFYIPFRLTLQKHKIRVSSRTDSKYSLFQHINEKLLNLNNKLAMYLPQRILQICY
jgi:hypothetical protein